MLSAKELLTNAKDATEIAKAKLARNKVTVGTKLHFESATCTWYSALRISNDGKVYRKVNLTLANGKDVHAKVHPAIWFENPDRKVFGVAMDYDVVVCEENGKAVYKVTSLTPTEEELAHYKDQQEKMTQKPETASAEDLKFASEF